MIVVPRDQVNGHPQLIEDCFDDGVLVSTPSVGQIARSNNNVDWRFVAVEVVDSAKQIRIRVHPAFYKILRGTDVEIADLRNDHLR